MAENNTGIKTVLDSFWKKPKHGKLFPISSSEELLSWNESINEENKDEMVNKLFFNNLFKFNKQFNILLFQVKTITAIIGEKGLIKGLPLIINEEILFEYNMEGIHGKKRFKTFKNILDVLYCKYDKIIIFKLTIIKISFKFIFTVTHTSSMVAANSPKSFDKHIRIAFKHLKNRHFKNISVKKKKIELELKKM